MIVKVYPLSHLGLFEGMTVLRLPLFIIKQQIEDKKQSARAESNTGPSKQND